jgi:hypothetical protein
MSWGRAWCGALTRSASSGSTSRWVDGGSGPKLDRALSEPSLWSYLHTLLPLLRSKRAILVKEALKPPSSGLGAFTRVTSSEAPALQCPPPLNP